MCLCSGRGRPQGVSHLLALANACFQGQLWQQACCVHVVNAMIRRASDQCTAITATAKLKPLSLVARSHEDATRAVLISVTPYSTDCLSLKKIISCDIRCCHYDLRMLQLQTHVFRAAVTMLWTPVTTSTITLSSNYARVCCTPLATPSCKGFNPVSCIAQQGCLSARRAPARLSMVGCSSFKRCLCFMPAILPQDTSATTCPFSFQIYSEGP